MIALRRKVRRRTGLGGQLCWSAERLLWGSGMRPALIMQYAMYVPAGPQRGEQGGIRRRVAHPVYSAKVRSLPH